ncbi:interferon-induced very large GTPase 1 [Xyrichtys novacula]|uniref:Interferon-induced very large GTPase 1 n=1 Tax=Xyrichtys novacula TaxID=13765 RepID=A0AAV1FYC5_XYRNO|nr:interferon-induced very large GTPase 1 [Xyrichtys novacula]
MSVKLSKRLSSKKKKPLQDNAQTEFLSKLGLEAFRSKPLDLASMLDISTWNLETQAPMESKDLPNAFLQRLWQLNPDARSTCCKIPHDTLSNGDKSSEEMTNGFGEEIQCDTNPLDLVSAVYMSSNSFLQQEITAHMMQCQFAVPLVLPNIDPDEPSHFLLWPLRSVWSQWRSHTSDANKIEAGDLASTYMTMISCVKLGRCGISKSQVLNKVIGGLGSPSETFLHREMDGGQLPRRLSNGLVEISWCLPTGDTARDIFPAPVVISNLRGDGSSHEKHLSLLCQASSAVVIFCGDLREKDKQLLDSCKHMANKLILIDLSDTEEHDNRTVGFADQDVGKNLGLPEESVLQGNVLSEDELRGRLSDTLKDLLPDKLKLVTLEEAAKLAEELGLNVDEGAVCKKAMAKAEEVLKGLEEGSVKFKKEQLPLQGVLWSKLARIEKEEKKLKKVGRELNPQMQMDKKDYLVALSTYKMTPAMKVFTDVLFGADKVERSCFLTSMKLKLSLMQTERPKGPRDLLPKPEIERNDDPPENPDELENGANGTQVDSDSDSFCTDSTSEAGETDGLPIDTEPVSFQQSEPSQDLEQEPTEETTEPQVQQNDELESNHDPVIHQELCLISKEKSQEINGENESSEEQISDTESQNQNSHSELNENGTSISQDNQEDEPEVTLAEPDLASSAKPQDVPVEHQVVESPQAVELDPSWLGLEHFMREMGLIFELTNISPGSGNQNVLRLPGLATDLLLYGIPLELMDGDASNIPTRWLGCVFAELKRRLPQDRCRTRVMTNLGVHRAKNAEVLSALFGVKFPEGRKRSTRGLYMAALCLPEYLREDMECDFLLLIDAEGLCSKPQPNKRTLIHDNEISTVATGLSDVLLHNISSNGSIEVETNLSVIVNALLRIKESASIPICQILAQDEGINSSLQALQLLRISEILQTETEEQETNDTDPQYAKTPISITCVKGPWYNVCLSEPVDAHYSEALLKLKQNLLGALKNCARKSEATGLSEFFCRLCAVWDAVKEESFSVGLQNTDIASALSLLCTELSQWKDTCQEHMENWLLEATKKIFAMKAKALDAEVQNDLLSQLKDESKEEVKAEVDKIRSKIDSHLEKDDVLKMYACRPILMQNLDELQEQETDKFAHRLEEVTESHCSSTQLQKIETLLEKEQESKQSALLENSRLTNVLLEDTELEEEFESVWKKTVSDFDFRPSETDDITSRVTDILRENLISRGLQKHIKKLEDISQNPTPTFMVYDEHFGYRSRLKHMFEDNNRLQRLEAQNVASNIIEDYNQFVAAKSSLTADFSDSYITELLDNVEKALKEKSMEIRSAFEVDLKVYLCSCACRDFQQLHDRYAKDTELLMCITANKSRYLAQFIYRFRKRDQCQRMAKAFTSMVLKPTVLDYIYKPLGMHIVEEIRSNDPQYHSPHAFHQSLLEELLQEDRFEGFLEYLQSFDDFRRKKIQKTVLDNLSESSSVNKWRQRRLGEIVGKIAAAVSQTLEGTCGILSNTKMLLERVCLTLEKDGDVEVTRGPLEGPLFSITTEWDRFVKCLMELLAAMRLDLAQEFSQDVDVNQFLKCLPVQPQDSLFNRVRGCEKQSPCCRAPCAQTEIEHRVHKALLHWPKGIIPNNSSSLSCVTCPESMEEEKSGESKEEQAKRGQTPCAYWRYVLARFNERFAQEYEQEQQKIPEEWRLITQEEALESLREAFLTARC